VCSQVRKLKKENRGLWNLNGKSSNYVTLITLDFMSTNSSPSTLMDSILNNYVLNWGFKPI